MLCADRDALGGDAFCKGCCSVWVGGVVLRLVRTSGNPQREVLDVNVHCLAACFNAAPVCVLVLCAFGLAALMGVIIRSGAPPTR